MSSPSLVNNLELTAAQAQVLETYGIEPPQTPIYLIKGELLKKELTGVVGFYTGHYLFFLKGGVTQHETFLKYLFGSHYVPNLRALYSDVYIYGNPAERFRSPENLVVVEITPSEQAQVNY